MVHSDSIPAVGIVGIILTEVKSLGVVVAVNPEVRLSSIDPEELRE